MRRGYQAANSCPTSLKFNCSPKLCSAGNAEELAYQPDVLEWFVADPRAFFKFVIDSEQDRDFRNSSQPAGVLGLCSVAVISRSVRRSSSGAGSGSSAKAPDRRSFGNAR